MLRTSRLVFMMLGVGVLLLVDAEQSFIPQKTLFASSSKFRHRTKVNQISTIAWVLPQPLKRVKDDYLALTCRVTARHILLPKRDIALTLKQRIRNRVYVNKQYGRIDDTDEVDDRMYIEDVFAAAACRFSQADTAEHGGLLGTSVPQGYCRSPELDRACFEVPLGEICGPIESSFGYHLILVSERSGCPHIDEGSTRIVRGGENNRETIFSGPPPGSKSIQEEAIKGIFDQIVFWIVVSFSGGMLADVAVNAAEALESLP